MADVDPLRIENYGWGNIGDLHRLRVMATKAVLYGERIFEILAERFHRGTRKLGRTREEVIRKRFVLDRKSVV